MKPTGATSDEPWVVSRPMRFAPVFGWAGTAAVIAVSVALAREQPWWLVVSVPFAAVLVSETMTRVCVGVADIVVKRPPLPSSTTPARDIRRLVRDTPNQMLVYAHGRRLPVNVVYLGDNASEVEAALLALADRHDIPVEDSPTYLELTDES